MNFKLHCYDNKCRPNFYYEFFAEKGLDNIGNTLFHLVYYVGKFHPFIGHEGP
jgi:hypothetical protein